MSPGWRLTLQAAVLGTAVLLALPVMAQDGGGAPGAQPVPQFRNQAPSEPAEPAREDAVPQQRPEPVMPSGCPFYDNKLELIA
jgi:hypothetical protein